MRMKKSTRLTLWLVANLCFLIFTAVAASLRGGDPRVLYVSSLFALCSAPFLWMDRLNGSYVLLAVLAPFYFVLYGMLDLIGLMFGAYPPSIAAGAGAAEWGILSGMLCILLGYAAGVRLGRSTDPRRRAVADWPQPSVLIVGLGLWLIGSAAVLYLQIFVMPEKTIEATRRGLASMGPVLTFAVMLGGLMAPLGMLILAYGYARFRTALWLGASVCLVVAQLAIGFVTDVRGQAVLPPVLVVVALTLIHNKLPRAWLLGSLVGVFVFFPILTAYRAAITHERGLSREQAAENLSKVIDVVLAYRDKDGERPGQEGRSAFFERLSVKDNVERVFTHTGVDVPFQQGVTLAAIPLAFVPRLMLPDKFDVPTGQLFNHTFFVGSDPETFISPSTLGELYWNFGWPGLVAGMLLVGTLLGFVGAKCNFSEHASVSRMLILLATVQYVCIGFEGAMSVAYILWLRSLGAVGILHLLFARATTTRRQGSELPAPHHAPVAMARFPNIMR
jgi:hypothetical protein